MRHWTPQVYCVLAKWRTNPQTRLCRMHKCDRRQADRRRYGKRVTSYRRNWRFYLTTAAIAAETR